MRSAVVLLQFVLGVLGAVDIKQFDLPAPIHEASGMVTAQAGGLWLHNDSDDDHLYRISVAPRVQIQQKVLISGFSATDWEDSASYHDAQGRSWIMCADCGDNAAQRTAVSAVILSEPGPDAVTANIYKRLRWTYADGARDVESLAVCPGSVLSSLKRCSLGHPIKRLGALHLLVE